MENTVEKASSALGAGRGEGGVFKIKEEEEADGDVKRAL